MCYRAEPRRRAGTQGPVMLNALVAPEDLARSPDRHRGTRLANLALPRVRAADLQAGVEVALLRHLARMGRPLIGLGAMAPSSLPTVDSPRGAA
jgi:hypothetical protein